MADPKRIAVFVFPDVEELDFVGPWEVLSSWARGWPDDGIDCFTLARELGEITCSKGLRIVPEHDWSSAPPFDLLILPGGRGTRPMLGDASVLAWVRDLADRGVTIASVCTGALVLAKCGLLDGKPATTHHGSLSLLRELGREIDVQPEARFVDNGSILTASGVSAGIDLALHLIVRMHSVERARQLRRHIQYDPSPPV